MSIHEFSDYLTLFAFALFFVYSVSELWKESPRLTVAVVGTMSLAFSFMVYDKDNPTTGLAALVYPDSVIEERIEAKQLGEELRRLVAEIKHIYSQPVIVYEH